MPKLNPERVATIQKMKTSSSLSKYAVDYALCLIEERNKYCKSISQKVSDDQVIYFETINDEIKNILGL